MSKDQYKILEEIRAGIEKDIQTWKSSRFANGILPMVAANQGLIEPGHQKYAAAMESLLNASTTGGNANKAVVSIEATKEEWLKKLADKLKNDGGKNSDIYKSAEKDINTQVESLKQELKDIYHNPNKAKEALYEVVRRNAAKKVSSSFLKQPTTSNASVFMSDEEKAKIAERVYKSIDLSAVEAKHLLKDVNVAENGLARIIEQKMEKHFGKRFKDRVYYLDDKKFNNEKNIAEFSKELNSAIKEKYSEGHNIKSKISKMISNLTKRSQLNSAEQKKEQMLQTRPLNISSPIQSSPPPIPPRPRSIPPKSSTSLPPEPFTNSVEHMVSRLSLASSKFPPPLPPRPVSSLSKSPPPLPPRPKSRISRFQA